MIKNKEFERKDKKSQRVAKIFLYISIFIGGFVLGIFFSKCPKKSEIISKSTEKGEELGEKQVKKESQEKKIMPSVKGEEKSILVIPRSEEGKFYEKSLTQHIAQSYERAITCYDLPFSPYLIVKPEKYWNKRVADFVFSPGITFMCEIAGVKLPCTSLSNRLSIQFNEDGYKKFVVVYEDSGCSRNLLEYDFIVDTYPPSTTILPIGFSDLLTSPEAEFRLLVSEPVRYTLCRIDDGFWIDCSAGGIYLTSIDDGIHKISAFSVDLAGNREDPPKEFSFRVDALPPFTFLVEAPPSITNSNSAEFLFVSDEDDVEFECNINDTGWIRCSPPFTISDLNEGINKIKIRSKDRFGRYEPEPVVYSWQVVKGALISPPKPYVPSDKVIEILVKRKGIRSLEELKINLQKGKEKK
jgi:hypothetical protein